MIAALFVEPGGVYFGLPGVEPWDESRDARSYAGPFPVVAHPPCGPWGKMRGLCTKQDASCGPAAVAAVRTFGGVLEHPQFSRLFERCGMPVPDAIADAFGGRTYLVRQVAWGHPCDKPTWLYVVGVEHGVVLNGLRSGGTATHRVTSGPRGPQLPSAHAKMRRRTPIAFRDFLLSIARTATARAA